MTKILIDEATVKLAMKAFKECHYYMLDAGLPNQSLLNQAFTAHKSLAEALKAQPKREWVGLTDEEYQKILVEHDGGGLILFYHLLEAKLRENNT